MDVALGTSGMSSGWGLADIGLSKLDTARRPDLIGGSSEAAERRHGSLPFRYNEDTHDWALQGCAVPCGRMQEERRKLRHSLSPFRLVM